MDITTLTTIFAIKKDLAKVLEANNYNLLSSEVITLSQKLDDLMIPFFKYQLNQK